MSESQDFPSPESTMDSELARILEQYLQDQVEGTAKPRQQWLDEHPKYAERLAACLDGVELIGAGGFLNGDVTGKEANTTTVPHKIGDYEIIRELGRGGMGVVYEARERALDRIVALKVMRFGVVDPKALERFQREAETAGDLHHTNIVPVYATGREGDTSWYAMQRIDGDSLAKRIQVANKTESHISLDDIVAFGVQAAEALHHAHEREVIHRDVKPANLIVDGDRRVWLTDFGLARRLVDAGATMTGAMMGTPRYMSPEQASLKGDDVDRRTDIYSLGATLFELATGEPPFDGDDPLSIISQIRYEDPTSIRKKRTDLPLDLDVVLSKCLEKDPTRRYSTAAELADDLRAIGDDRAISARPISLLERAARATRKHGARFRLTAIAIAATAATLICALAAWQSWKSEQLGAFRFRAGGGPFVANVKPIGGTSFSPHARSLTVPMQVPAKLKAGEYDMLLAPRGRWSKNVRLPVSRGSESEYRMGGTKPTKQIDIEGINAIAVAGFDEACVLLCKDGQIQRVSKNGANDWTVDVSNVKTSVTLLADIESEPTEFDVNFAATDLLVDTPLNRARFEKEPQDAAPQFALPTPIDLNLDQRSDFVIAAPGKPSLLALDSDGNVLWARSYGLNTKDPMGNSSSSQTPNTMQMRSEVMYPAVMDLMDVGDQDGDGVNDIAAMIIQIRSGTRTDSAVVLISGKGGSVVSVCRAPALKVADGTLWPKDALLRVNGNVWRDSGTLSFGRRGVRRNRISNSPQVRGSNSRPRFAIPAPLKVCQVGDKLMAVHHTNDTFRIFDLSAGKQVGDEIKLPFKMASAPRIARISDNECAAVFTESGLLAPVTKSGDQTLLIAYRISDGSQLWRKGLRYIDWSDTSGDRSRADWPLAKDINGDGKDELLIPTKGYLSRGELGVQVLDSETGGIVWKNANHQIADSADEPIRRIAVTADIDNDGWLDIVTASISGDADPNISRAKPVGNAYVYVDWISGKTGRAITWARSQIPLLSDRIDVAEIDAIRCDVPGGETGAVEVDLITGDSRDDLELDSAVIRFHPSSPDPTDIAAGLEAISISKQDAKQRIYYARPGPYAEGPERLVFLDDERGDVVRLGEHDFLATWDEPEVTYLALRKDDPPSLVVVDADSMQTVWKLNSPSTSQAIPVTYENGTKDLLTKSSTEDGDTIPILVDGKSGKTKWTMQKPIFGNLKVAHALDGDSRILVIGDGRVNHSGFPRPPDYFKMTMVNAKSGSVIWSKHFLRRAPRLNTPDTFDDLRFVDVNGDGHADIVGPDQGEDEQFGLAVWDGATGEQLWFRSLFFRGSITDYFVLFCLVDRMGKPAVAYFGPETQTAPESRSIIVCDAKTGEVLMSEPIGQGTSSFPDRTNHHNSLALADGSPSVDEPRLALMTVTQKGTNQWRLFDIREEMKSVDHWEKAEDRVVDTDRWLHDVNHDSIPERFVASKQLGRESYRDYTLACFSVESNDPMWQAKFSLNHIRGIHWQEDPSLAFVEFERWHLLLDLKSGRELSRVPIAQSDRFDMPMVTAVRRNEDKVAVRVAIPAREGIINRWVGDVKQVPFSSTIHQENDPRRIRPLFGLINMGTTTPWEILVSSAKGLVALLTLVLAPFYYVWKIFRRRRFSLSWMMLAPIIAVLFILVWNSNWVQNPGRFYYILTGFGVALIPGVLYSVFKRAKSERDDRSKFFGVFAAAFIVLIGYCYFNANDPSYVYQYSWSDIFKIAWASICFTTYLYCIGCVMVAVARFRMRRQNLKQGGKLAA